MIQRHETTEFQFKYNPDWRLIQCEYRECRKSLYVYTRRAEHLIQKYCDKQCKLKEAIIRRRENANRERGISEAASGSKSGAFKSSPALDAIIQSWNRPAGNQTSRNSCVL